jgi:hypothetical protein
MLVLVDAAMTAMPRAEVDLRAALSEKGVKFDEKAQC